MTGKFGVSLPESKRGLPAETDVRTPCGTWAEDGARAWPLREGPRPGQQDAGTSAEVRCFQNNTTQPDLRTSLSTAKRRTGLGKEPRRPPVGLLAPAQGPAGRRFLSRRPTGGAWLRPARRSGRRGTPVVPDESPRRTALELSVPTSLCGHLHEAPGCPGRTRPHF